MTQHLAIFRGDSVERILRGEKKVDLRLSRIRIAPFGLVKAGDVVLMRKAGRQIGGSFTVERVIYFDHPTKTDLEKLIDDYHLEGEMSGVDLAAVKFATVIFITAANRFLIPPQIVKKDRRPWLILS